MKQIIITIMLALVAMTGWAQEIKRVTATAEDFMEHMKMCGYEVFTFDISSLRDSVSGFSFVIREYDQTGMINEEKAYDIETRTMISDFPEEDKNEIYATKDADDLEHGIYRLSKTFSIGFTPAQSDSIENINLWTPRTESIHWSLKQKPIQGGPRTVYRYRIVPYQPSTFCLDKFTPLILYCSFWWDNRVYRCCGEMEMTEEKEKASNFFKYCPHYYILGAEFHK